MAENSRSRIVYRIAGEARAETYAECYQKVRRLTRCFWDRGLRAGDLVAIHGDTSYFWLLADLTSVYLGLVSIALYPTATKERALAILRETGCRVVLTDQPSYAEYFAEHGLEVLLLCEGEHDRFETLASHLSDEPRLLSPAPRTRLDFTIVSTSGTVSEPKLFCVAAAPLLTTMQRFAEIYGLSSADNMLVFLPMCHLPQRMLVYGGLDIEMSLILSSPAQFIVDSRLHRATVTVTVPRVIEHLDARLQAGGSAMTPRDLFGEQIRLIFVGSAPIRPALLDRWRGMGAPLYEVYGTTEIGMIALNQPGRERSGTVGLPIPWGDVKLDPDTNEILARTTTPFLHGRVGGGGQVVVDQQDESQYHATGDVGQIDEDGYIRILGRLRDFVALQSGVKIFVGDLEARLVEAGVAPLCLLVGNGQRHLSALLFFPPDDERLARRDELDARCGELLRALNQKAPQSEQIRSFVICDQMPDVRNGCMTETQKLRRHRVVEVFWENSVPVRV
ncbi:AMP-binding protein [Sorangium sp. So ce1151]|uniref:AMP-binding protein n=1 Tax=Sorangium sp. So ce1151 TaxID=3133332 RepID=UPI003F636E36